jgi:hypothetical protein
VANSAGGLAVLLAALFGGFLMSRAQMPALTRWLSSLSFVRWASLLPALLCGTGNQTVRKQLRRAPWCATTTAQCLVQLSTRQRGIDGTV